MIFGGQGRGGGGVRTLTLYTLGATLYKNSGHDVRGE